MWIYIIILLGSWLYRWYQTRKVSFIVDGKTPHVTSTISTLLMNTPNANIQITRNGNESALYQLTEPMIFDISSVRFSVRLVTSSDVSEDQVGSRTNRIVRYDTVRMGNAFVYMPVNTIEEKKLYQFDILSGPISYPKFRKLIQKESVRLSNLDKYNIHFDILTRSNDLFIVGSRLSSSPSIPFFHSHIDLITSTSSCMLFHGPSGNGKSVAASWIAHRFYSGSTVITSNMNPVFIWKEIQYLLDGSYNCIIVLDHLDQFIQNPKWIPIILHLLRLISFYPYARLIATVRDLSTLNGTGLVGPSKFKLILFDYPDARVMNQITQHYYHRDYLGSLPKFIPIETIREYARTKSYEEFTTIF